ncbi:ABC-type glycerol-3-phosphate transport system substrate-binding protein [Agromyces hippuratus]|uniref:ABC-type glycerol-3-phosphate transport system substrate-binding protein n=1 Tax=Agromyces hippuratus TaxID=286438 RepID=A0A852WWV2_9MICO|nr:ABC transporter substrate-binding protein [Agromyces hippuratus]NYG22429.1 ABC-type glycerol-3-phosphate transport system substrate-binding protein [Agromyces hippuratus]
MKITRRSIALTAGFAAASLVLAGCSAGGTGDSGPVEVRMLVNITPNLTEDWWNELVAPFEEANPDIDVKIQAPVAEGVKATLPQLLASGDVPDIVETLSPTPELAPELVDLSAYDWATEGPLAEQYSIDGKVLMAGVGIQLQGVYFYNKQAFADAGIEAPPATTEEFDAALEKLKAAGWTPIQTSGEWATQVAFQYAGAPTVLSENPDWFAEMSSGDLTFGESYGDTVDRYAGWVADGYIPADSVGLKYADGEQQFLAGKSAIYPMGSWFAAAAANATDAPEIGVFPAPADEGVAPAQAANVANPYVIMKASKQQDAAAKVVEFLVTDQDAVTAQLEADGNFRPGYEYEMSDLATEMQAIVADTEVDAFTPLGDGYGDRTVPAGYQVELNTQVQGLLTGTTPDAVVKAMDDWFTANR